MPTIIRFSSSGTPPEGQPRRPPNQAQAIALAVVALTAGALLLAFGLLLLAAVAAAGTLVGGGVVLYHRITGRWPKFLHVTSYRGTMPLGTRDPVLDPTQEVFAPPSSASPQLPPGKHEEGKPSR